MTQGVVMRFPKPLPRKVGQPPRVGAWPAELQALAEELPGLPAAANHGPGSSVSPRLTPDLRRRGPRNDSTHDTAKTHPSPHSRHWPQNRR